MVDAGLITELSRREREPLFAWPNPRAGDVQRGQSLPYGSLEWQDFERLTFRLLVAAGKSVRFFGRPGQAQYGVDLVADVSGGRAVFQCKHLDHELTAAEIKQAIDKFKIEWLGQQQLPAPTCFTLCCPQRFDDLSVVAEFERLKHSLKQDCHIDLEIWHRDT